MENAKTQKEKEQAAVERVLNNEKSPSQLKLASKTAKANAPMPQDVKDREELGEIHAKILTGCRSTFTKDAHGAENRVLGVNSGVTERQNVGNGLKLRCGVTVITQTGARIKGPSVPGSAENSQGELSHRSASRASVNESGAKPKQRSPPRPRMSMKEYLESTSV